MNTLDTNNNNKMQRRKKIMYKTILINKPEEKN